jgi:hypothetical protein
MFMTARPVATPKREPPNSAASALKKTPYEYHRGKSARPSDQRMQNPPCPLLHEIRPDPIDT